MPTTRFLMYSFKGGAGRTVTTCNVALALASRLDRRVLVIDLDVESAGSSVLFGLDERVRSGGSWALQDVLRGFHEIPGSGAESEEESRETIVLGNDFEERAWPRLYHDVWPRGASAQRGFVKALPARIILRSSQEASVRGFQAAHSFERLLRKVEGLGTDCPDIILFDSASGMQDTANMGLANCDVLVVFVRWTRQFVTGTIQFLSEYVCSDLFAQRIKRVLVVPTAVPHLQPSGLLAAELEDRRKRLEDTLRLVNAKARHHFGRPDDDWIELTPPIMECDALKWDDRIFLLEPDRYAADTGVSRAVRDYESLSNRLAAIADELT